MAPIQRTQDAVDILCDVFLEEALTRWMFPAPPEQRRVSASRLFEQAVAESAKAGTLDVSGADAAAVWLPVPADARIAPPPEVELPARLRILVDLLAQRHPIEQPHLYLAFLGVTPGKQGLGLGGALLAEGLRRADTEGLPAYLEASSSRNLPLYERHGFRRLGNPIELPDGPSVWPMWRDTKEN
ncbi:GNAT family N-acetyltransferase [Crossiella sp. CA-258035]|uniref:GNAT family N-acetyltransferase n=1 Tax=Crossiella sp. CA-258035 TaxID=2981138 RepID=UPI0024BD0113|nr:GNAT family N-acetyltransferase [Crossiella sp. CA-258035]WHT16967.1 GNAT family N-acetyltransferase [Crossiella sp. CA-258035]